MLNETAFAWDDLAVCGIFEVITTQHPKVLMPCIYAGEDDKLFTFLLEMGIRHHHKAMSCKFKNSLSHFVEDFIPIVTVMITRFIRSS